MKHAPSTSLLAVLLATLPMAAGAGGAAIEFDGGIGSQPLAGTPTAPIVNDVRGVPPGGRPWEIRKLKASVRTEDGQARIVVKGEGLILGGGNSIGLPAAPRMVAATLFCGADAFSSAAVLTNAAGDFRIRSVLTGPGGVTELPDPCTTPTLLIRNAPNGVPGAWFAAGIPKLDDPDGKDD